MWFIGSAKYVDGLPAEARALVRKRAKAGGERGIRTLGRVSPTHAFQACSFNHSDISPHEWNQQFSGTAPDASNTIVKQL